MEAISSLSESNNNHTIFPSSLHLLGMTTPNENEKTGMVNGFDAVDSKHFSSKDLPLVTSKGRKMKPRVGDFKDGLGDLEIIPGTTEFDSESAADFKTNSMSEDDPSAELPALNSTEYSCSSEASNHYIVLDVCENDDSNLECPEGNYDAECSDASNKLSSPDSNMPCPSDSLRPTTARSPRRPSDVASVAEENPISTRTHRSPIDGFRGGEEAESCHVGRDDLFMQDLKLKFGCFIKLVNCQVLLKPMLQSEICSPKRNKRKISDDAAPLKSKIAKLGKSKKHCSQKPLKEVNGVDAQKPHDDEKSTAEVETTSKSPEDSIKPESLPEVKEPGRTFSNSDSNIFTNMTSFLFSSFSGKAAEDDPPPAPVDELDLHPDEDGNFGSNVFQPIVKLIRLPGSDISGWTKKQPFSEEEEAELHRDGESIKAAGGVDEHVEDVEKQDCIVAPAKTKKLKKNKKSKEEKSAKQHKEHSDKKKEKPHTKKLEAYKNLLSESKKLQADETRKKLQDIIGIKPTETPGSLPTKRIPKIDRGSDCWDRRRGISAELDRRDLLERGAPHGSMRGRRNEMEDAGWTTSHRKPDPRPERSGDQQGPPPRKNLSRDSLETNYRPQRDFNSSRRSPPPHDRIKSKDSTHSSRGGTSSDSWGGARRFGKFPDCRRRSPIDDQKRRYSSSQRGLLPLPVSFNAFDGPNLPLVQQPNLSEVCGRLQQELEKIIHSQDGCALLTSPRSNGSVALLKKQAKEMIAGEPLNALKSFLPQELLERFNNDILQQSQFGRQAERFHSTSPESSASSLSYKDMSSTQSSLSLPGRFLSMMKDGPIKSGMNVGENMEEVRKIRERNLLRKMEEEIGVLETLVRVQGQLAEDPDVDESADAVGGSADATKSDETIQGSKSTNPPETDLTVELKVSSDAVPPTSSKSFSSPLLSDGDCRADASTHSPRHPSSPATNSSLQILSPPPGQAEASKSSEKDKEEKKKFEEKVISLSRNALKSYYHNSAITSQEFKVIMKKAVTKISESKSRDVSQPKVSRFIDNLVSNVISKRKKLKS